MAAYLISDLTVRNAEAFEIYRTRAAEAVKQYGGRYLVRGGAVQALEGEWKPQIVVVEFSDVERALAWYHSPEYAPALAVHDTALQRNMIIAEGYVEL